jgi:hypothetical protein
MTDRNTQELMETLGTDVERCRTELLESVGAAKRHDDGTATVDYEYHGRQLVRAILAYIEGVTYSVKLWAIMKCTEAGVEVSDHERYAALELDADLNDKGEIEERRAKQRLVASIRFAFRLLERAQPGSVSFDPAKDAWWSDLLKTIRVRDRLTHPKKPEDVDISPDELMTALRASQGFGNSLLPRGHPEKEA